MPVAPVVVVAGVEVVVVSGRGGVDIISIYAEGFRFLTESLTAPLQFSYKFHTFLGNEIWRQE